MNLKTGDTAITKICAESGTATLTSNLTGSSYRWQVDTGNGFKAINDNANYVGTQTQNLQLNNLPAAWYGHRYRCVVQGELSTSFTVKFSNDWTGAVNNLWENAANWSCGTVPGFSTDVVIPAGSTVVLNSNTTIRSLKLEPGASFTVATGYTLTVTNP
jgi:hypothetical protein